MSLPAKQGQRMAQLGSHEIQGLAGFGTLLVQVSPTPMCIGEIYLSGENEPVGASPLYISWRVEMTVMGTQI